MVYKMEVIVDGERIPWMWPTKENDVELLAEAAWERLRGRGENITQVVATQEGKVVYEFNEEESGWLW